MAAIEIDVVASTTELRETGGSGGNATSTGAVTLPRGASQSITSRLTKNEVAITARPSRIALGRIGRRIISPNQFSRRAYRAGSLGASAISGHALMNAGMRQYHVALLEQARLRTGNEQWRGHRAIFASLPGRADQLRLLAGFSACRSIGSTITLVPTLTRE